MNFGGHNVGDVVKKLSWQECSDHCNEQPICFGWSYVSTKHPTADYHQNCHMKDATFMEGKQSLGGSISGVKGCGTSKCQHLTTNMNYIYLFGTDVKDFNDRNQ